jgi:hypothetical protein
LGEDKFGEMSFLCSTLLLFDTEQRAFCYGRNRRRKRREVRRMEKGGVLF